MTRMKTRFMLFQSPQTAKLLSNDKMNEEGRQYGQPLKTLSIN